MYIRMLILITNYWKISVRQNISMEVGRVEYIGSNDSITPTVDGGSCDDTVIICYYSHSWTH